tara:strand:- start:285 stop:1349 length:1065 start_codon:yes stop_codon:yes gene_type:complete
MKSKKRILVSPLNWGLGHATRCVPIIKQLILKDFDVIIAAEGRSKNILKNEFPELRFINIPGVNIKYYNNIPLIFSMLFQIPKILYDINREHKLLQKFISEYKIHAIISDNRFGLWTNQIPCVFITHQLRIKSPLFERLIQKINYYFINKFTQCWIIDDEKSTLSGKLSCTKHMPKRFKYIGPQSRIRVTNRNIKYDLLCLISGPEPERSNFESLMINKLSKRKEKSLIILGKIEDNNDYKTNNCRIISSANSEEISLYMSSSKTIISRSGYSTIMDLAKIGSKCIFIPTPGQTEQEYLAQYLKEEGVCFSMSQKSFDLEIALKENENYRGFIKFNTKTNWDKLFSLFQDKRKC